MVSSLKNLKSVAKKSKSTNPKKVLTPDKDPVVKDPVAKDNSKAKPISEEPSTVTKKSAFGEEELKKYIKILSDGKPHKLSDLLDTFSLPHTSSGREKLRNANRKIAETNLGTVEGVRVDNASGKHFKLTST